MNSCETRKCRFWDGEKCNDKNDWISAEDKQPCCGLRSDAVLIDKPKRKPLSDGTLPLTNGELEELRRFTGIGMETVVLVEYVPNQFIWVTYSSGREETLDNVKAILYLAERFDLTEK